MAKSKWPASWFRIECRHYERWRGGRPAHCGREDDRLANPKTLFLKFALQGDPNQHYLAMSASRHIHKHDREDKTAVHLSWRLQCPLKKVGLLCIHPILAESEVGLVGYLGRWPHLTGNKTQSWCSRHPYTTLGAQDAAFLLSWFAGLPRMEKGEIFSCLSLLHPAIDWHVTD